jgi:hypothetical protein
LMAVPRPPVPLRASRRDGPSSTSYLAPGAP